MDKRQLGKTNIEITAIGLGCWQFMGSDMFWGNLEQQTMTDIVRASLEGGVNWFDTAEAYGGGKSEMALAAALVSLGIEPDAVIVATKWLPVMRFAGSIKKTIGRRIDCLKPFAIDLHQVHQPISFSSIPVQMAAMADLVEAGKIRSVGVSNFNEAQMREAHAALQSRGLVLASNQVRYSMLDRKIEKNGVVQAAKELGITIIAYSPLEQGVLTGKFHDNPELMQSRAFARRQFGKLNQKTLERTAPLIDELRRVAGAYGVTAAQVALNWVLQVHGEIVVAIPGATKVRHAEENAGAMAFTLTGAEVAKLDEVATQVMV